ncbi:MAG: hypothetical protein JOZ51_22740, partial [Chloroflexi bacterium]|nr:hypothetical protein [Chloroflexota bacterium]
MRLLILWLCLALAIIPSARVIPVAAAPEVAAPLPFPITHEGHFGGHVRIVKVEGQTGYLAEGNYFTILDLRALPQIAPLASLPLTGPVYDIAIAGSRAYLAVANVGLVVVNMANLQQPSVIATVPLSGASTPDDVEVAGTVVYLRTRGDGLRIYDLQTPGAPEQLGHYAAQFDQLSPGTTLARHGTTLYAVTNTLSIRGVHVIDASNPHAPSLARIIPSSNDGV